MFKGSSFVLDFDVSIPFKQKLLVKRKILDREGQCSPIVGKKTTVVICSHEARECSRCQTAVRYDVPIVSSDFIDKCIEAGKLLDTGDFVVSWHTRRAEFERGTIRCRLTDGSANGKQNRAGGVTAIWPPVFTLDRAPPLANDAFEVVRFEREAQQVEILKWRVLKARTMPSLRDAKVICSRPLYASVELQHGTLNGSTSYRIEISTAYVKSDVALQLVAKSRANANKANGVTSAVNKDEELFDVTTVHRFVNERDAAMSVFAECCSALEKSTLETISDVRNRIPERLRLGSLQLAQIVRPLQVMHAPSQLALEAVDWMWKEANEELDQVLTCGLGELSFSRLDRAEACLRILRDLLFSVSADQEQGQSADGSDLVRDTLAEYYSLVPHGERATKRTRANCTRRWLAKELDLVQLIRDMLCLNEAVGDVAHPPAVAKYAALRCRLEVLSHDSQEFNNVCRQLGHQAHVQRVLRVERQENDDYDDIALLGNEQMLLHGTSSANCVGILSRGLLLPGRVENELGVRRSDLGRLGAGLYFTDSLTRASHFATPAHNGGLRTLFVCAVTLGKCMATRACRFDAQEAPAGFDSVCGVPLVADAPSCVSWNDSAQPEPPKAGEPPFEANEFVVYNAKQQRLRYLVQFTLPNDAPPPAATVLAEDDARTQSDLDLAQLLLPPFEREQAQTDENANELPSQQDKTQKKECGIVAKCFDGSTMQRVNVPLREVHVRATLTDLVARVSIMQLYAIATEDEDDSSESEDDETNKLLDATFRFPLPERATVCGFEAFVDTRHLIGRLKEKQRARTEFREAVAAGQSAYLLERDDDDPQLFTVRLGNLAPRSAVLIRITLLIELQMHADGTLHFTLPGSIAPFTPTYVSINCELAHLFIAQAFSIIGSKRSSIAIVNCWYFLAKCKPLFFY